jgi:hypothetical protein
LLASVTHADKKPTIAVLGVIPEDSSLVKQASTLHSRMARRARIA